MPSKTLNVFTVSVILNFDINRYVYALLIMDFFFLHLEQKCMKITHFEKLVYVHCLY